MVEESGGWALVRSRGEVNQLRGTHSAPRSSGKSFLDITASGSSSKSDGRLIRSNEFHRLLLLLRLK